MNERCTELKGGAFVTNARKPRITEFECLTLLPGGTGYNNALHLDSSRTFVATCNLAGGPIAFAAWHSNVHTPCATVKYIHRKYVSRCILHTQPSNHAVPRSCHFETPRCARQPPLCVHFTTPARLLRHQKERRRSFWEE